MTIKLNDYCDGFAENKDVAKELRENLIKKAISNHEKEITIDFKGIDSSTQSFIHALISEIFQKYGERILNIIQFRNCNKAVKSLITTVINYSLG